jgi:hypothetical protein
MHHDERENRSYNESVVNLIAEPNAHRRSDRLDECVLRNRQLLSMKWSAPSLAASSAFPVPRAMAATR